MNVRCAYSNINKFSLPQLNVHEHMYVHTHIDSFPQRISESLSPPLLQNESNGGHDYSSMSWSVTGEEKTTAEEVRGESGSDEEE